MEPLILNNAQNIENFQNQFETIYDQNGVKVFKVPIPQNLQEPEIEPQFRILKCTTHIEDQCTYQCQLLQNEYFIHSQFPGNDLVVHHYDFQQDISILGQKCCCIEMEYCRFGDLADAVLQHPQGHKFYQKNLFKTMITQVLQSVKLMHDNNISVNDIKFNNFFVMDMNLEAEEPFIKLKIGDLGYAYQGEQRTLQEQNLFFKNKLRDIMSPELIQIVSQYIPVKEKNMPGIDEKLADIYAIGVMGFEIFTRIKFVSFQKIPLLLKKLVERKYLSIFALQGFQPHLELMNTYCFQDKWDILNFIVGMLQTNPENRQAIENLLE